MSIKDFVPIAVSLFAVDLAVWFDKNKKTIIRIVGIWLVTLPGPKSSHVGSNLRPFVKLAHEKKAWKRSSILRFFFRGKLANKLAGVSSLQQEVII